MRNNIQRYYNNGTQKIEVLKTNNKAFREIYADYLFNGQYDLNSVFHSMSIPYADSEGITEMTPFDSKMFYKSIDELETKAFIDKISMSVILSQLNVRRLIIGKEKAYVLIEDINRYLAEIK